MIIETFYKTLIGRYILRRSISRPSYFYMLEVTSIDTHSFTGVVHFISTSSKFPYRNKSYSFYYNSEFTNTILNDDDIIQI